MTQIRRFYVILAFLLLCVSARAGILVFRSEQGIQFAPAVSITFNAKDKALSLGGQPTAAAPISKLPSARLEGTLLKDGDAGVVLQYDAGKVDYLLPEGLPKNAPEDPAGIWKTAKIVYKQSASDKTGTEVAVGSFIAFLPVGPTDLAALCTDAQALQLIGGKGKSFSTQIELMAAAVKAYATDPAMAPLEKYVEGAMRTRYEAFENGAGGVEDLNQGLRFVQMSKAVYPNSPEQEKLRQLLTNRKAWLDRKIAVQKAFASAAQWDAFLLGDRDLERHEQGLPEMASDHTQALQGSLQLHLKVAITRQGEGDYGAAYHEFRLASLRKPSDSTLRDQAMQAWTEYSRRHAMDLQAKRTKLAAGQQSVIARDLDFADRNRLAKNLDEALKNVQDAERELNSQPAGSVSNATLSVWYEKASILGAQGRTTEALAALDSYDLVAVEEERTQAEKLRFQLQFNLDDELKSDRTKLQAAWSEGNFSLAQQLTAQGLKMNADDADLLYNAGMAALIKREPQQGRDYLTHYLEVSDTLDANQGQRAEVRRLLPTITVASATAVPAAGQGDANWLSGEKLPKGVFYCPISLAFQPHIDHIDASNKLHETFEWAGERLKSVTPTFESVEHVTGEKKISFGYENRVPQVFWASDGDAAQPPAPTDPDEAYKRATVLLLNNPQVDPVAIQRLTGKAVAVTVAGNRFFNPFVWDHLYYFALTYDDSGRVSRAQELTGPKGAPGEQVLEFEWNGMQLTAIRGYVGKTKNYERTMQYQDGLLVGEDVVQGKPAHIKYVYAANRLVSADAATDTTLDNRSRKVTFLANSPSTLVK